MKHRIVVPDAWLRARTTLEIQIPDKLVCAVCEGGGCDACGRAGVLRLREREEAGEPLRVVLPVRQADAGEFVLRIPGAGAAASSPDLGPGHLLLSIRPEAEDAAAPSAGVVRVATASQERTMTDAERKQLMVRSLLLIGFLCLTFLGLLRLSGWL